jgi:prepilin-type N-terminal cleavage/methylation domain-containing protein
MGIRFHNIKKRAGQRSSLPTAFTLIELMVAIAIMGVIVFALYNMFNQTQKAMRSNETQSDVSEKARAVIEMVSREIEQSQPTYVSTLVEGIARQENNFFGGLEYPPKVQKSSDRGDIQPRTNMLYNVFFLNNRTSAWQGIGYRVINVTNGVGALERYEKTIFGQKPRSNYLASAFNDEPMDSTNYHQIADGVIHFKVVPFDFNGYRLGFDTTNRVPGYYTIARMNAAGVINKNTNYSDTFLLTNANCLLQEAFPNLPQETRYTFMSNALPAYVDLELGILEPDALKQYYAMLKDQNPGATNYLSRQINKVHLYRERIPIRTAAQ